MGNQVHDTAIIGPGVELGEDTVIGPYAVLTGPCRIGDRSWVGAHAVVGAPAEIRGRPHALPWRGDPADWGVVVGEDTTLREATTVHQGSERVTWIGSRCYVMNKSHIGHDCVIGDDATLSASATLAGHVEIGAGANVGMGSVVHQRRVVASGVMIGMGSVVTRDVPPYAKVFGAPARVHGVNEVGLARRGFSATDVAALAGWYGPGRGTDGDWQPPEALRPVWEAWLSRPGAG